VDGVKAALVVAAYEFEDPKFRALRSPARDVEALASVLGDPAVGGFGVQTVVNQPGPVVQQELERFFSGRRPDDLLLVYFSCHGVKDAAGKLHFATTNTLFELLRSTGISASFVSEQLELTRSKRVVVLLDCCYSGAFLKGFRERGDDSISVSQLEGRGRAVITASRATEYAFEADELTSENAQPSVFTGAIVEGLTSGAADRDGDGLVTVEELYDYVYDHVRGQVAGQTPGCWVDVEGDLVIARNPRPPVQAEEAAEATDLPVRPGPPDIESPEIEVAPRTGWDLDRATGWAVAGGGVAMAFGLPLPFWLYDGASESLIDYEWNYLWMLVLAALCGYATFQLLSVDGRRDVGRALVVGTAATAVPFAVLIAGLAATVDFDIGAGFWLVALGGVLFGVAAGMALVGMRGRWRVVPPRSPSAAGMAVGAAVVGVVAALTWGELNVANYTRDSLYVSDEAILRLTVLLTAVSAAWCLVGGWLRRQGTGGTVAAVVAVAFVVVAVLSFLGEPDVTTPAQQYFLVMYVLLALGATVVPLVATLLTPPRTGIALLAGWAIASIGAWVDHAFERDLTAEGQVLIGALLVSLVLAYLVGRRPAVGVE